MHIILGTGPGGSWELGIQSESPVWVAGAQILELTPAAAHGAHKHVAGIKSQSQVLNPGTPMGCGHSNQWFNLSAKCPPTRLYTLKMFLLIYFIWMKEQRSSICWFIPQKHVIVWTGQGKSRSLQLNLVSHVGGRNSCDWAVTSCLPWCTFPGNWNQEWS